MKVVTLLSGGLDSTVLLAHLINAGHSVKAMGVDYGQRHASELNAAKSIAAFYGVSYDVVGLRDLRRFMRGSSQTDAAIAVPDGHYESSGMAITVVPNRNMILLSVAAAEAESWGADAVAYAAHHGDHAIYPDCREEFVKAAETALSLAIGRRIYILSPFIRLRKNDIAKRGAELDVPMHLTWSCYKGRDLHCGTCGTCHERREAFSLAGVLDPTYYELASN